MVVDINKKILRSKSIVKINNEKNSFKMLN